MIHRMPKTASARRAGLRVATGVAALAATFAFGAVSQASAAAPNLTFTVQQPAGAEVCVQFAPGFGSIIQTTATGTNMARAFTNQAGFCVLGKNTGANDATVQVLVLADGSTIAGSAQISGSSSLSYSIGNGPATPVANGDFSIPVPVGSSPADIPLRRSESSAIGSVPAIQSRSREPRRRGPGWADASRCSPTPSQHATGSRACRPSRQSCARAAATAPPSGSR